MNVVKKERKGRKKIMNGRKKERKNKNLKQRDEYVDKQGLTYKQIRYKCRQA